MTAENNTHDHTETEEKVRKPQPSGQAVQEMQGAAQMAVDASAAFQRVIAASAPVLSHAHILALQQASGNRAVQRLIAQGSRYAMGQSRRQTNEVVQRNTDEENQKKRQYYVSDDESAAFIPDSGGEQVWLEAYRGSIVRVRNTNEYEAAGNNDLVRVTMQVGGKIQNGRVKKEYILWEDVDAEEFMQEPGEVEGAEGEEEYEGDQYKLTVAVARQNPNFLEYQKQRLKLTIKNKLKGSFLGKLFGGKKKSTEEIKKKAAKKAVKARTPALSDEAVEEEVNKLVQGSVGDNCGHSWIKLHKSQLTAEDTVDSFGFYPAEVPTHPLVPVAGEVVHPDTQHESVEGEEKLEMDYPINQVQYNKAMKKAEEIKGSSPQYKFAGYNCTTFARDIAKLGGVSMPGKAWVAPFVGKAYMPKLIYTPNAVYEAMEKIKQKEGVRAEGSEAEEVEGLLNPDEEESQIESEVEEEEAPVRTFVLGWDLEDAELRVPGHDFPTPLNTYPNSPIEVIDTEALDKLDHDSDEEVEVTWMGVRGFLPRKYIDEQGAGE